MRLSLVVFSMFMIVCLVFAQAPDSLWSRTYGGDEDEVAADVIQTSDGGFLLTGYTFSFGSDPEDLWVVKTDSNGDSIWSKTYGGEEHEAGSAIISTSDGGYAIAGHTMSNSAGLWDLWLLKIDSLGDSIWSVRYGGSAE